MKPVLLTLFTSLTLFSMAKQEDCLKQFQKDISTLYETREMRAEWCDGASLPTYCHRENDRKFQHGVGQAADAYDICEDAV
ncbi:hypothetical protein GGR28_002402 [Lewinella aquimaris]|uniref:Uncharacterized protein n=1 Tax=Neolewinella aquimaris TaxID=1835722 RepID=A0A840E841_9BACT|nr:hypothetical protein [Neolewinella aquimaris]MBB4079775.1 hypothetical protein [Neolewinella aquimaris]